jgi:hypothetical protein
MECIKEDILELERLAAQTDNMDEEGAEEGAEEDMRADGNSNHGELKHPPPSGSLIRRKRTWATSSLPMHLKGRHC